MKMSRLVILATMIGILFVGTAHAFYNNLGRGGEKAGAFTKADLAILKKALYRALDKDPDGKASSWKNPDTGASGTIQPTRTFTWKSYRCRTVDATVVAKTFKAPSRYKSRMCFVPGRGWLISE